MLRRPFLAGALALFPGLTRLSSKACGTENPATTLPIPLLDSDRNAGQLRVATYNILGARNTDGKRDLTRITKVLKILNPDVIALQEVDVQTGRIQQRDIPKELETALGWKAVFGAAMPFNGGEYGVAILSKLPILRHKNHVLPTLKGNEPRAALEIECLFHGEQKVTFIGTHLENEDEATRLLQVDKLLQLFPLGKEGGGGVPGILAGDLNASLKTPSLQKLLGTWETTWPAARPGPTWPAKEPRDQIDHILTQPKMGWSVRRTETGLSLFPNHDAWRSALLEASDHLPVICELTLAAPKGK